MLRTKLMLGVAMVGVCTMATVQPVQAKVKAATTPKVLRGTWGNTHDLSKQLPRYVEVTKHWVRYGKSGMDGYNTKAIKVKKLGHWKDGNTYLYRIRVVYGLPGYKRDFHQYLYFLRNTYQGKHMLYFDHSYNKLFDDKLHNAYIKPQEFGLKVKL
ncbi:MAG TPA: hypothetical protein H9875_00645 [Candidatus Levilactobacillus faecigallinarum]|uniref:Uncharacterized protein n=1 Tax=Candidatus Levilactobacillus faecigallinarum TaxID=2838638 RepID=A0A9D1QQV4_9LACO|nr:hypothetical protein [Candidatus Levilactobacillus faecigallinarum]